MYHNNTRAEITILSCTVTDVRRTRFDIAEDKSKERHTSLKIISDNDLGLVGVKEGTWVGFDVYDTPENAAHSHAFDAELQMAKLNERLKNLSKRHVAYLRAEKPAIEKFRKGIR